MIKEAAQQLLPVLVYFRGLGRRISRRDGSRRKGEHQNSILNIRSKE